MIRPFLFLLVSLFLFSACGGEKDYLVTFKTKYGDMHAILYEETPRHRENFLKLVNEGFYDSLLFHRVIRNFMIQGGDPNSRNATAGAPLGTGDPGYTIEAEFVPSKFHKKGALSAARQPDNVNPQKNSSGSQFYIVQGNVFTEDQLTMDNQVIGQMAQTVMQQDSVFENYCRQIYETEGPDAYFQMLVGIRDSLSEITGMDYHRSFPEERLAAYTSVGGSPHLDDAYTVFGEVIDGFDVIDKIAAEPTGPGDRPTSDVVFSVTAEELPKAKITREYGYEYPVSEE